MKKSRVMSQTSLLSDTKNRLKIARIIREGKFDEHLSSLITLHKSEDYAKSCFKRGLEAGALNSEMFAVFSHAEISGDRLKEKAFSKGIREIDREFPVRVFRLEGYDFVIFYGQGAAYQVWKDGIRLF